MFLSAIFHSLPFVELVARAGGGGSSSSGGGGAAIIVAIGYFPMHFLGRLLRQKLLTGTFWLVAQVTGWLICVVICVGLLFFGWIGLVIGAGAVAGMGAGLYGWFSKLKLNKQVVSQLHQAAALDATWDGESITERAREVFFAYQKDWSAKNWQAMAAYMTSDYYRHATLMITALDQAKRINDVRNPKIKDLIITRIDDQQDDNKDRVIVGITAKAEDVLLDAESGAPVFTDRNEFTEFWTFTRRKNQWYLAGIEQATEAPELESRSLREFAKTNGFFYSLDWGWLLIPRRGQLFGRARFGTSDINNHVIGVYNDAYLLQLYTYDPVPDNPGSYLIAQTNIPKSYGDIVVRRKHFKNVFSFNSGLDKISTEWREFNDKYEVLASQGEGATSFELLHPAFMEKLEALPFEVNIEVVDNVVYLYSRQTSEKNLAEKYRMMLEILQEAYKQMKM